MLVPPSRHEAVSPEQKYVITGNNLKNLVKQFHTRENTSTDDSFLFLTKADDQEAIRVMTTLEARLLKDPHHFPRDRPTQILKKIWLLVTVGFFLLYLIFLSFVLVNSWNAPISEKDFVTFIQSHPSPFFITLPIFKFFGINDLLLGITDFISSMIILILAIAFLLFIIILVIGVFFGGETVGGLILLLFFIILGVMIVAVFLSGMSGVLLVMAVSLDLIIIPSFLAIFLTCSVYHTYYIHEKKWLTKWLVISISGAAIIGLLSFFVTENPTISLLATSGALVLLATGTYLLFIAMVILDVVLYLALFIIQFLVGFIFGLTISIVGGNISEAFPALYSVSLVSYITYVLIAIPFSIAFVEIMKDVMKDDCEPTKRYRFLLELPSTTLLPYFFLATTGLFIVVLFLLDIPEGMSGINFLAEWFSRPELIATRDQLVVGPSILLLIGIAFACTSIFGGLRMVRVVNRLHRDVYHHPDDPLSWNNKGIYLAIFGLSEDAHRCFEKALELDPENWMIRHNMYLARNNYLMMTDLLSIEPLENPMANSFVAMYFFINGLYCHYSSDSEKKQHARPLLVKAMEIYDVTIPRLIETLKALKTSKFNIKEPPTSSQPDYERMKDVLTMKIVTSTLYKGVISGYLNQNDASIQYLESGIDSLRKYIKNKEKAKKKELKILFCDFLFLLSQLYLQEQQLEHAIKYYEMARVWGYTGIDLYFNWGMTLFQQGRYKEAVIMLKKAKNINLANQEASNKNILYNFTYYCWPSSYHEKLKKKADEFILKADMISPRMDDNETKFFAGTFKTWFKEQTWKKMAVIISISGLTWIAMHLYLLLANLSLLGDSLPSINPLENPMILIPLTIILLLLTIGCLWVAIENVPFDPVRPYESAMDWWLPEKNPSDKKNKKEEDKKEEDKKEEKPYDYRMGSDSKCSYLMGLAMMTFIGTFVVLFLIDLWWVVTNNILVDDILWFLLLLSWFFLFIGSASIERQHADPLDTTFGVVIWAGSDLILSAIVAIALFFEKSPSLDEDVGSFIIFGILSLIYFGVMLVAAAIPILIIVTLPMMVFFYLSLGIAVILSKIFPIFEFLLVRPFKHHQTEEEWRAAIIYKKISELQAKTVPSDEEVKNRLEELDLEFSFREVLKHFGFENFKHFVTVVQTTTKRKERSFA